MQMIKLCITLQNCIVSVCKASKFGSQTAGPCTAIVSQYAQPSNLIKISAKNSFSEIVGRFTSCVCVVCFRANEIIVNRDNLLTEMTSEEGKFLTKNMAAFPCTEHETMRSKGQNSPWRGEQVHGLIFEDAHFRRCLFSKKKEIYKYISIDIYIYRYVQD